MVRTFAHFCDSRMIYAYWLLGLAIVSVWFPALRFGPRAFAAWPIFLSVAVASAFATGLITWAALIPLAAMSGLAWLEMRWRRMGARRSWRRNLAGATAGAIALALALHALPGFHNEKLFSELVLSAGAPPVTQYLNFDKGVAGLLLLIYCPRIVNWDALRQNLPSMFTAMAITTVVVVGLALAMGYVRLDPKFSGIIAALLATKLLFVVVAEETFFRGLIQAPLFRAFQNARFGWAIALIASTAFFVVSHAPMDTLTAILVALTGLGAASAFALTRRIEAAILTHFTVNAVHVLLLTYPRLQA